MTKLTSRNWWILGVLGVLMIAALGLFGCGGGSSTPQNDQNNTKEQDAEDTHSELNTVEDGKLTVAASLDFPPFENMGEGSTEAEGFTVDLMKAIGEKLGLEVVFQNTKFDSIIPAITSESKADVGASSITITPKRQQEVDFTDTYMLSNQGVVVQKDSGITEENYKTELEGKTIAVQSGTTGEEWAKENIPGANVSPYDEMTAVFNALGTQAEAVVADLPVVKYYVNESYPNAEIIAEIPTGEVYGIAVSKNNPNLVTELNKGLKEVKDDGQYAEIYKKWFGEEPSEAVMNATYAEADDNAAGDETGEDTGALTQDENTEINGDGGHETEDAAAQSASAEE